MPAATPVASRDSYLRAGSAIIFPAGRGEKTRGEIDAIDRSPSIGGMRLESRRFRKNLEIYLINSGEHRGAEIDQAGLMDYPEDR